MNGPLRRLLRHPAGLQLRLTLWCLLVCSIALAVFGAALLWQAQTVLQAGLDVQLSTTAAGVIPATAAVSAIQVGEHGTISGLDGVMLARVSAPSAPGSDSGPGISVTRGISVTLVSKDAGGHVQVLNLSPTLRLSSPSAREGRTTIPAGLSTTQVLHRAASTCATRADQRVCTQNFTDSRGRTVAVVQAADALSVLHAPLAQMRLWLLLVLPLVLLLVTAGGWVLAGRTLAPIDRITRTAAAIGAGNLSKRFGLAGRADEVSRLAATFDGMLERLAQAFAQQEQALLQQRAFAAAASHEMRTPLTVIKTELDVLRRGRTVRPEEARVLQGLDGEVVRLARLVEDLLTLARAESETALLDVELVALDVLVTTVADDLRCMAQEKGVHLDTELATELEVVGDPVRLRQVVRNLLDNAIRYTPAGGAIHVTLHGEAGEACLQVIDNGSGIAAADLPYIFDSFYRTDEARNRQQGGTGLGLAIARRWSNVHAGRITVASQLGLGSTFTLWLPLAVVS